MVVATVLHTALIAARVTGRQSRQRKTVAWTVPNSTRAGDCYHILIECEKYDKGLETHRVMFFEGL